jgi:hypothetical protein
MKTKAEVVQMLLDERKITAEDAVILLTPEPKQIEYIRTTDDFIPLTFIHRVPNWWEAPYYLTDPKPYCNEFYTSSN